MKQQLLAEFNAVVAEAEQLLKFVTDEGGDKANALRANRSGAPILRETRAA